ncbi:MAG: polysaccharide deacetylase family protein [Acidimicrobiales bacterium]
MTARRALAALALAGLTLSSAPAALAAPVAAFYAYQAPGSTVHPGDRVIALTFDDGPDPTWTPQILAELQKLGVPATFFEIGIHVAQYPSITQSIARAGYPVEDHTWTHPDLTTVPVSQFPQQIDATQSLIQSLTGIAPSCVRPPYNSWNSTVLTQIDQRGLTTMSYSIDPKDWTLPGTATIANNVVQAAFPGAVVDMHDGGGDRSQTLAAIPGIVNALRAEGYTFVSICGATQQPTEGDAYSFGAASPSTLGLTINRPLVGGATTPDGGGYWLTAADGGVFTSGDAPYDGSAGGTHLNAPVVSMAPTPDGKGYWLTAADGGVFTYGDASYLGSKGGTHLNAPIVGVASTPDGAGYWLVAADGGVFTFGDAAFYGSTGAMHLNAPIVGMAATPDGKGYWLVASDGGVFTFGDAAFYGSTGNVHLNAPVVGMAADAATGGYWLVAAEGGVFNFNAPFYGSQGGSTGNDRFTGMASLPAGTGYVLIANRPVGG